MDGLLSSERLYMRLIEKEDLPLRVKWINDPDIQATLNYDYPTSLARTERWFANILMDTSRRDFSLFCREGDVYIGFCGLMNIDSLARKSELYMVIGSKNYWGAGYGTEGYKLLTSYGFIELGLNKIYGYQLAHNQAAHRAVEKIGWQREGFLRQDLYSHGKIWDRYRVAILKEDWAKLDIYYHGE